MDEAFPILIAAFFFELLWAFYRAIELIFNSRDLEMAAENVNLVTRAFNFNLTVLYLLTSTMELFRQCVIYQNAVHLL